MDQNPHAFAQLEGLLRSREARYARAEVTVETSGKGVEDVVDEVIAAL